MRTYVQHKAHQHSLDLYTRDILDICTPILIRVDIYISVLMS